VQSHDLGKEVVELTHCTYQNLFRISATRDSPSSAGVGGRIVAISIAPHQGRRASLTVSTNS
jgi:hypothetical protein